MKAEECGWGLVNKGFQGDLGATVRVAAMSFSKPHLDTWWDVWRS